MRLIYLIATLILLAIALTVGDATAQALQRNVPRATGCTSGQAHDPACDVNHNGTIDLVDIQLTAGHWGQSGTYSATYSGVPRTGQTTCYDSAGGVIPCADTGQDGDLQTGNPWPVPRFADNSDGKVTDRLTGLVWLKNARCGQFFWDDTTGHSERPWSQALLAANSLSSGFCDLADESSAEEWRLPNVRELHSLVHYGFFNPALPNTAGTRQ